MTPRLWKGTGIFSRLSMKRFVSLAPPRCPASAGCVVPGLGEARAWGVGENFRRGSQGTSRTDVHGPSITQPLKKTKAIVFLRLIFL